jgi:hypothetical protein
MTRLRLAAVATALLALAGCNVTVGGGGPQIQGSGVAKSESRPVSGFTAVSVSGIGKVTVTQTGKESLTVKADDNILPLLTSEVKDGVLTLGPAPNSSISTKTPIEYVVEVKELRGLTLAGATHAEASGVEGKSLTVSAAGASNASVSGRADAVEVTVEGASGVTLTGGADGLTAKVAGASHLTAEGLSVKRAKVDCEGTGRATVNASDQLDASASGASSVEYLGSPRVNSSVSGVGRVSKHG